MTSDEIYAALAVCAPDIEFSSSRELDEDSEWDGDGPDPVEEGFSPYVVTVTARCIANGRLQEGERSLSSSYFRDDEEIGDVHGYLPQMLEEAASELLKKTTERRHNVQLEQVLHVLSLEMRARWQAQQQEKST